MPLISVAIVTVIICFSSCYDNTHVLIHVCYCPQVPSINEVLLIGNYQYDTALRDFVYDMQREYKMQVRLVADMRVFCFVSSVSIE